MPEDRDKKRGRKDLDDDELDQDDEFDRDDEEDEDDVDSDDLPAEDAADDDDVDEEDDEGADDSDDSDDSDSDDDSEEDAAAEEEEEEEEEEDLPTEEELEAEARARKRARRRRAAERKKRAEKKKAVDDVEAKPRRSRRSSESRRRPEKKSERRRSSEKKSESRRPSERRRSRRDADDEPRRSRRRGAVPSSSKRRRRERQEADAVIEIVEPKRPPEAEIDLSGDLEPTWEPGVLIGGGLGLGGVAFAFISLLTSGGQASIISIIGLVILLIAISSGNIGVLARKTWGYILALGASGLGVVAGLLWSLYSVVGTDMSPLWPLFFFLCNLGAIICLFQMKWGPGPLADERDRMRSLKLRTSNHTTVSGELVLSGSIAAVLASVLCGLLLMGAATDSSGPTGPNFIDGVELQAFTEAPELGTVVLARWGNEDYFFLGRVEQSRAGDEFHVVYLDNDRAWVRMADIRRDTIRAGMSVHVHVQGHDGWLPAVVTQRSGNRVEAELTNNQRVWVPLGMIRIREAP